MEKLDGPGVHFKQTADIDMSGQSWTPFDFDGYFDGNGQKISHVKIDQPTSQFVGFFSQLASSGELKNIHLEDVEVKGGNNVGGLVGNVEYSGSITNSYATGSVTGSSIVGGLVGSVSNSGSITNSYANGSVTGTSIVGGLVGNVEYSGSITNSYATGSVTGASFVGGLVGIAIGSITSSYYDTETTGRTDTGKGTPYTTVQMKEGTPSASIYVGWDINIWDFGTIGDYPTLWVSTPVTTPVTVGMVTGTAQVGQTLTAAVTPPEATVTYQWQIATTVGGPYADIAEAISNTYTPVADDAGKFIKVVVTGTGSYTGTATSDATPAVAPTTPAVTTITAITGIPQVGQTLTAGDVTPVGATVTYQWQIADTATAPNTNILGATSNTYTPVAGDTGKFIRVVAMSYAGAATSAPTTAITPQ